MDCQMSMLSTSGSVTIERQTVIELHSHGSGNLDSLATEKWKQTHGVPANVIER